MIENLLLVVTFFYRLVLVLVRGRGSKPHISKAENAGRSTTFNSSRVDGTASDCEGSNLA